MTRLAQLPERQPASAEQEFELCEDEAEAFALFTALDTQWRRHPLTGSRLGLINEAIPATAGMLEMKMTPQLLTDLQTMELAALEVLAARR